MQFDEVKRVQIALDEETTITLEGTVKKILTVFRALMLGLGKTESQTKERCKLLLKRLMTDNKESLKNAAH